MPQRDPMNRSFMFEPLKSGQISIGAASRGSRAKCDQSFPSVLGDDMPARPDNVLLGRSIVAA